MKPEPIDNMIFGNTLAQCFDKKNKLIGKCIDTPNGIAKAIMEHPEIYKIIAKYPSVGHIKFPDKITYKKDYEDRMNKWNDAKSYFKEL